MTNHLRNTLSVSATAILAATSCAAPPRDPQHFPCLEQCRCRNWVDLEFDISDSGEVLDPRVIASCATYDYESMTLRLIRKWRYGPEAFGDKGVRVQLRDRE